MAMKTRSSGKLGLSADELRHPNEGKVFPHLNTLVMLSQQLLSLGRFNKDLPSYVFKGVDSEQLWQQLELRNNHRLSLTQCTKEVVQISNRERVKKEKKKITKELVPNGDKEERVNYNKENIDDGSDSDSDVDNELNAIKTRLAKKDNDEDALLDFANSDEDDGDDYDDDEEEENDFDFEMDTGKSERLLPKKKEGGQEDKEGDMKMKSKKKVSSRTSAVDDKFFKMAEMEKFLDAEDRKEEKRLNKERGKKNKNAADDSSEEEEEEIDLFAEGSDSEEYAKYTDFFDPPNDDEMIIEKDVTSYNESSDDELGTEEKDMEVNSDEDQDNQVNSDSSKDPPKKSKKNVSFSQDLFESDNDEKPDINDITKEETKSTFEQKQEKLARKVREMEELSLQDPSWELTGEVKASKRPENSLLEKVLDVQHTFKAAPIITDDTTKTLEDYIKLRIKDKTFDDVERKEKPKEDVFEFKKRIVLDQEKSKQSLAEIYEQEFIKQQKTDVEEVKTDPLVEKIEKELNGLFYQLDALSNFRYTPMQPGTEVKIMVNTPAITLEEVAPVATTDADLLAPEEVRGKLRGDLKAKEERDETDRKRARRQKKLEKKEKKKAKEAREKKVEKLKPGMGNKYSKIKALKQLEELSKSDKSISLIKDKGKGLKSSSAFFSQLQDEVTTNVKAVKAAKAAKKEKKKRLNAGALML